MKAIYYLIIILVWTTSLMGGCSYDDKSTYPNHPISEIIIDTSGIPEMIFIPRLKELLIAPKVSRVGNEKHEFIYEWRMTLMPGTDFSNAKVIGEEEMLRYSPIATPDAKPYGLWYRVTDKATGLMRSIMWKVVVEASSGQGLVVAYTKDGTTSDFAVVQDTLFTLNWKDEQQKAKAREYRFDVFSAWNNHTLKGVVRDLYAQSRYHEGRLTYMLHGASKNNVFRINSLDYSLLLDGKENFYDPYIDLDVDFYIHVQRKYPVVSNHGRVMRTELETQATSGNRFGLDAPGNYYINRSISYGPDYSYFSWYDEVYGKFFMMSGLFNIKNPPYEFFLIDHDTKEPIIAPFDPTEMPGWKALAGGNGDKADHRFVLSKGGQTVLFTLSREAPRCYAKRKIDLSGAPEIHRATSFVIPNNQEVIFYAVDNIVYAILFSGGTLIYKPIHTANNIISFISMLRQSGDKEVPYNERCLMVVVNSAGGSKIDALLLGPSNTGIVKNVVTLEGFPGEVSAIAVQD